MPEGATGRILVGAASPCPRGCGAPIGSSPCGGRGRVSAVSSMPDGGVARRSLSSGAVPGRARRGDGTQPLAPYAPCISSKPGSKPYGPEAAAIDAVHVSMAAAVASSIEVAVVVRFVYTRVCTLVPPWNWQEFNTPPIAPARPPPTPRPPPSRFSELAQCAPVAGRADAGRFVPLGRGPLGGAGCWCGGDWPREWLPLPGRL